MMTAPFACTPDAPLSVTVSPSSIDVPPGAHVQFSALVEGSFDNSVTWAKAAGVGEVDASGNYTAPSNITTARSATIRARSVADPAKFSDSAVTVLPGLSFATGPSITVDASATIEDLRFENGESVVVLASGTNGSIVRVPLATAIHTDVFAAGAPAAPRRLTAIAVAGGIDTLLADRGVIPAGGAIWGRSAVTGVWQKLVADISPEDARSEDMNGDAFADIVSLDASAAAGASCAGGIRLAPSFPAPAIGFSSGDGACAGFAVADLDLDTIADIALVDRTHASLFVAPGFGASGLGPFGDAIDVGNTPVALDILDVDDDQARDVVIAGVTTTSSELVVLRNLGALRFAPAERYALPGRAVAMAVADLESDGRDDVAIALADPPAIAILRGSSAGALTGPFVFPIDGTAVALTLGDEDGDGLLDVIAGIDSNGAAVLRRLRNTSH